MATRTARKSAQVDVDKPVPVARRNADETRARILRKAISEFAAKGFSGARIDAISKSARTNIRMLYHYFGSKEQLYLAVLEQVIQELRDEELKLDFSEVEPQAGLLQMFDFIDRHFSEHRELMSILSSENMDRARHMKKSARIPAVSSPVLALLRNLLDRGVADGTVAPGIDPLHLYVMLVALAAYHRSNMHTLSFIFKQDVGAADWQAVHKEQTHRMLISFFTAGATAKQVAPARKKPRPAVSMASEVAAPSAARAPRKPAK
ncbi:MAG: TetR/AcrR family transcriptional regulator [Herminiimonas sp.]|nr:TetR/AcrR family transcriptional regulator [Herminiimonas sp.]MDB5855074.1 TetR/AcrR family transcriptional regulator [Herminiimonas sp.]